MRSPFSFPLEPWTLGGRSFDLSARAHVMGILNVTPDSFSDGGRFLDPDRAAARGVEMVEEGADFIDIGGESSRPKGSAYGEGARPVTAEEECARVLPVIDRLVRMTGAPLSIDTSKAEVARRALDAGATVVNDISGLRFDPDLARVIGEKGASVVLMHIRGTPQTMQQDTAYTDLFGEITAALAGSLRRAREHGIRQCLIDPGIGFGKNVQDNVRLLAELDRFHALGAPVLVGTSRKSFLGALTDGLPVEDRLEASIVSAAAAVLAGAQVVRVLDVRATKRAVAVADAVLRARRAEHDSLSQS
jgi:dihydropteroate synthase